VPLRLKILSPWPPGDFKVNSTSHPGEIKKLFFKKLD